MRLALGLLAGTFLLISGCSVSTIPSGDPAPPGGNPEVYTPISGIVHGGQQPVQGAQVYLLEVTPSTAGANNGYGEPSTSKLQSSTSGNTSNVSAVVSGWYYVKTNSTGGFNIAVGDYTCTSGHQVYLFSVGGNAGFGANSGAGLMTVLGQCGTNNSFTGLPASIQMNEVTTVAAAYALAGFATDAVTMSGSNSTLAATGMKNAAANFANLVNLGTGLAYATPPSDSYLGSAVPQAEINTLADILAACVNSSGPGSGACSTLFSNAKNSLGAEPTDTATAAINIAHNPGANISELFSLASPTAPFQSSLSREPNDWTIAVTYTASNFNGPSMVAVDGSGNVWLTNSDTSSINQFSPAGKLLFTSANGSGGMNNPFGIALDTSGNIWVANNNGGNGGNGSISEFDSSGNPKPSSPFSASGALFTPWGIGVDPHGNIWVANLGGSSLSEYVPGSGFAAGSPFQGGGLNDPLGLAIDHSGNIWAVNTGGGNGKGVSVSEYSPTQGKFLSPDPAGFSGGGLKGPVGVGIDSVGNVWAANEFNAGASQYSSTQSKFLSPNNTGYTGGGLSLSAQSDGLAVDGLGNAWIANFAANSISEFNSGGTAISGSGGFQANLGGPQGIAVDPSGNVWVASDQGNALTQFIGAAAPVVTPLVTAEINNTLGTRP